MGMFLVKAEMTWYTRPHHGMDSLRADAQRHLDELVKWANSEERRLNGMYTLDGRITDLPALTECEVLIRAKVSGWGPAEAETRAGAGRLQEEIDFLRDGGGRENGHPRLNVLDVEIVRCGPDAGECGTGNPPKAGEAEGAGRPGGNGKPAEPAAP